jgi:mono/diheme cytochrome c family protein
VSVVKNLALVLAVTVFGVVATLASAADTSPPPAKPIDFGRDIYPILQRSCLECHGPEKQKGKLRLDSRAAVMKGGTNGPALIAGKASESELYRRIALAKGADGVMPNRGELLSAEQIAKVRDWINQGATWPDQVVASKHWAYVQPVRPALPAIQDRSWPRTPIDYFIRARLEKEGLTPSPEADRAAFIRRVSLDLIGLPPAPAEVDAFIADRSPDAYEKLVDRLLASPHFGERWARPWLDLARYADSHGFQRDDLRPLWAYRDWVIRAFNADMPFDRFTLEQLAGDLLPKATEEQKIATGFHRCTPTNVEAGSEPEETRINQVIDRVNTTAAVWLGSTLECAQCHDHKYDPFKQHEYYRLLAFFNNTAIEADRANPKVPGSIAFLGPLLSLSDPVQDRERERLRAELRRVDDTLSKRRHELERDLERWAKEQAGKVQSASQVHVLQVKNFASSSGSPHRILKDHSVLLVDDPPDIDTYTITVQTKLTGIRAFKLETLMDANLPGDGPGRGDPERPNFVLNTFEVSAAPIGKKAQPVKLVKARADFSQSNYGVEHAIDNDPNTGWAIGPQFHRPHWAIFEMDQPLGFADGTELKFKLVQQFGKGRTIGRLRLSALVGDPSGLSFPADIVKVVQTPKDKRSAADRKTLVEYCLEHDPVGSRFKDQRMEAERAMRGLQPVTTLTMQEMAKSRTTNVFTRGNFLTPGIEVKPGVPGVLHKLPDGPGNRVTLANWLVNRDNPLVARVTVNRWWAELFGRGIVSTVEDFGIKGEPPTHPELLDWLAVEFMDNGWSMKRLLRTIVLSATYRQSSRLTPELRARDDQNLLLARGPRFRLDAETIRDNALAASGLLSHKAFGPPIRPFQPEGLWIKIGGAKVEYRISPGEDRYRRGVYVIWKRGAPYPSFVNFDASARLACTVKRSRSNTPLQALTLLNDPVYVEAAMALARRIVTDRPDADIDARISHAFRLCLARAPSSAEAKTLRMLFDAQQEAGRADAKAVAQLLKTYPAPQGIAPAEFAAWYAVATALLNLDEMITKG